MAAGPPTCHGAEDDLDRVLSELRRRGLLKTPYQGMIARGFRKCQSCRKSRKKRKKCLGWHLQLRDATAIEFRDCKVDDRRVFARVRGVFSTKRSDPDTWQVHPYRTSSCAIEVREFPTRELIERHHHDLANSSQPGPLWHLQLGGSPAKDRWLDIPRWPIAPMDPVLVIELAVYSFFNDAWNQLRSTNPWRDIIKRSEKLLLPHYRDRLHEYLTQGTGVDSWLAHQCNLTSGWDPRPG